MRPGVGLRPKDLSAVTVRSVCMGRFGVCLASSKPGYAKQADTKYKRDRVWIYGCRQGGGARTLHSEVD
jgi:hypothetical protein